LEVAIQHRVVDGKPKYSAIITTINFVSSQLIHTLFSLMNSSPLIGMLIN
jgi:hypothetical protein